jgi:hypothetical protein
MNNTGGYHNTSLQTTLQTLKNSMALAQKQIRRPVEQNRGPRHESMQLQSFDFPQRFLQQLTAQKAPGPQDTGLCASPSCPGPTQVILTFCFQILFQPRPPRPSKTIQSNQQEAET